MEPENAAEGTQGCYLRLIRDYPRVCDSTSSNSRQHKLWHDDIPGSLKIEFIRIDKLGSVFYRKNTCLSKRNVPLQKQIKLKKMKKILTFFLAVSCYHLYGQGILDGFQILRIPREKIPIGAEWINGIGVNGTGVSDDNITINRSLNLVELDKDFKQGIDLAVLGYLNLDATFLASTTIHYKNLTIYTLSDISKTSLNTGQLMIYESIKADSIYFKVNKELDAGLKLKLNEKIKELQVNGKIDLNKGVNLSGSKLFLAFRVFELGKTKVISKTSKIKDPKDGSGLREVKLLNYQMTFNDNALKQCVIPNQIPIDKSRFINCSLSTPIDVVIYNFNRTNISGKPLIKETDVYNNSYKSLYFSQRSNSILVTDYIEITYVIENSNPMLFFYMDGQSKVVVKRMETILKMFKNPKAPGW
jgi:hypothetical protein